MALADLSTVAKRIDKLEREARVNPKLAPRVEAAKRLRDALEAGTPARVFPADSEEAAFAREAQLLTVKPMLYVANVDEAQIGAPGPLAQSVFALAERERSGSLAVCGKIEAELAGLSAEEAAIFRGELGIDRSGLDSLVLSAYELLGLMTFLTAGEKEVRAWTIERGTKAPQAAGKIHSDIERGFIRAEIVSYDDYARLRTMDAIRSAGLLRSEGKEYVMQEGDVVNFRFNV
jgi:ribosome-binding ATPase YchF (GTP1/OBG family)